MPVSEQIGQSLVAGGVHSERVRVLYSGLNLDAVPTQVDPQGMRHQLGIPAEAQVLGTVANLFPRKGYEVMLNAMPTLLTAFPQVHYVIVGTGDTEYEARLRALTRSEEHTSELQSQSNLVCRLLLEKKRHQRRPPPRRSLATSALSAVTDH